MRLRSAALLIGLSAGPALSQVGAGARGRTIDEGTFVIATGGASQTENFKIVRNDNGLITATGQLLAGAQQITSTLTADSVGTPVRFEIIVRENGARILGVTVTAVSGRLTALSLNQRGDQSMREYPMSAGHCFILDDALVHQLYFLALAKQAGPVDVISPRDSRSGKQSLSSLGLEPITVGGHSLTATHYALGEGQSRREFWVDAGGRLLRAEIPARKLVATRDDPPK